jgi:uncharacterized membrane protein YccC
MSRSTIGLLVCAGFLAGIALLASLPISQPVFDIVALGSMIALLAVIEWPRWRHPRATRWPNKLGKL